MPSSIDVTDDPADFDEAVRAFRRRVPMPDWKWDALTEAEREFAFKVSGAAQADLATQAWEAMDRAIKDGTTLDDFKRQVGGQLEAAWGKADPARLETIFRTNALGAYNAGRHEILNHPEVKKARPYWRFDGVDDDRQTEICEALDGTIRPADDPFWNTHTPPLHFNAVAGDTEILTAAGPVEARLVRPWMQVLSHARQWRTVTAVLHKWVYRKRVLRLQLATGRVLRVTQEHPALVHTAAGLQWRQAGRLHVGDQLLERGDELMRPEGARVVDAKDAPPLGDEPRIPSLVVGPALRGRVALPIGLHRYQLGYERQIHDVGPHGMLGHGAVTEDDEQVAFCWSERVAIRDRLRLGRLASDIERRDWVRARHTLALSAQAVRGLGAHAPGPMARAAALRDHCWLPASDSHLVALGPHGDAMADAPEGQQAVAQAVLALERPDAALALPVGGRDQRLDALPVGAVEWHAVPIVSIAVESYQGELVDLSVDADETYVAGGVVVHNCRSVLVPLSQEEAEEEGIDEKSPEVDADDGFGHQPSGDEPGGGWEPDPKDYPPPIADVLEEKLQVVEAEPEPPAPPPPPPDYGPSFPRLPLEAAPELPRAPQPKWQTPPKTEDFFTQNDEPIVMGSRNLDNLVNAPGSFGTHTVLVSDKLTPGAVADYWLGRIRLSSTSAKELQVAIQRGEIRTQHELEAAGTLVHEHFHGSSNPHYDYEVSGSQANHERVAGTVMEESTTELLAQHYREDYSRGVLHLKVTHGERDPLFKPGNGGDGPELGRPVAYSKWVRGFARAAAFADDALLDMQPAEFQSHVAGRAMQIKAQPGRTERHLGKVSERYGVFMTQIFDRYGVTAEVAQSVSMQLHDLLADFIQGRPGWEQQRIADLKTAVEGIIDMGKASKK